MTSAATPPPPATWRVLPLDQVDPDTPAPIGSKARNLARMVRAGLPVPKGYCIAAPPAATGPAADAGFRAAVAAAWQALGSPPVAVRSSGEGEDGLVASLAGQLQTFLGLRALEPILSAIEKCVASAAAVRVEAYQREVGAPRGVAIGVILQEMMPADQSGVLFTAHPRTGDRDQWVVEAAHGPCEAVVAGKVTPKQAVLPRGGAGGLAMADELSSGYPLSIPRLTRLFALAGRVEALFGVPQDIEWCVARNQLWLLQSRPITTLAAATERRVALLRAIDELRARAQGRAVVWNRSTLADTLPEPLPMTWAVARRFMGRAGAYGRAFAAFGFEFAPDLGADGIAELVLGRTYVNLDREARTYFGALPVQVDAAALRAHPEVASAAPKLDMGAFALGTWLALPAVFWRGWRMEAKARALFAGHAARLRAEVLPALEARARAEAAEDLRALDAAALAALVGRRIERFAGETLVPAFVASMLAARAYEELAALLGEHLGAAEGQRLACALVQALPGAEATDPAWQLGEVAAGRLTLAEFLVRFGHRAAGEMELARPRWSEAPAYVEMQLGRLAARPPLLARWEARRAERERAEQELEAALRGGRLAGLGRRVQARLRAAVRQAQTYHPLREIPKHSYLMEYAGLRRALVALDERLGLDGGIFFLVPEELGAAVAGRDLRAEVTARRRARRLERSIPLPDVIWSDALDRLGQPPAAPAKGLAGLPVSGGVVEGTARVVLDPAEAPALCDEDILIAPSTDPGWTPLFAQVRGVVLECGGLLSHGAVVAREMGLPAVTSVAGATRVLKSGDRVRLDADAGTVEVLSGGS